MRTIKFRAWHKEKGLLFKIKNLLSFGKDGEIWINENKQQPINTLYGWAGGNLELMQYTGLKDKNGVELYEGDIAKLSFNEDYSNNCVSVGEGSIVNVKIRFDYQGVYAEEADSTWYYIPDLFNDEVDIEIIGNIYENPELLENNHAV